MDADGLYERSTPCEHGRWICFMCPEPDPPHTCEATRLLAEIATEENIDRLRRMANPRWWELSKKLAAWRSSVDNEGT